MKSLLSHLSDGPVTVVRWVGVCLGILISLGLLIAVAQDRAARAEAARRQSYAIAIGVDRLLRYEIRNLERALRGISPDADGYARDFPDSASWDLSGTIRGVLSRHAELQDIDLYDHDGGLLYGGLSRSGQPMSFQPAATGKSSDLIVGPLQRRGRSQPVIPLAVRTPRGNWLVAGLRVTEVQRMLEGLDVTRDGSVAILDQNGVLLARHADSARYVGKSMPQPVKVAVGSSKALEFVSPLDGIERYTSLTSTSSYPFIVAAGLSKREALKPWWNYAATALALLLSYWLGMLYLTQRMAAAETSRRKTHHELLRHADWLSKAQEVSRTGVWAMEPGHQNVRVSAQAADVFGFVPEAGMVPLADVFGRMHDADRSRVESAFERAWAGEPFQAEYRIVLPDGRQRWISARSALALDADDKPQMTGTIVDITERRTQQERLQRTEAQFRELFELNPLPFWVFDTETLLFLAVNATAVRLYGYSREEFLRMTILQIRPQADIEAVRDSVVEPAEPRDSSRVWLHVTRDGRRIHVRIHSSSIEFDGRPARLVLAEDVSDRVAYEADLAWRASHDGHTGLLNLRTLLERFDRPSTGPAQDAYAVAYVQLRDLELVSPALGRRTSDEIVAEIARRLSRIGEIFGPVAHLPSDAFVASTRDAGRCRELVDCIVEALSKPVQSESGSHRVEAWIGTASHSERRQDAEEVVGHASLAALQARAENSPTMAYADSMSDRANTRLATIRWLRRALVQNEFELFFQPIRRVRDGTTFAAEALLRWRTGAGYVAPSSFIPLVEESGLIVPIGEWVMDKAAEAHVTLAAAGIHQVAIAVNVSAVQFLAGTVAQALRDAQRKHGLPRGALHVELTESAMLRRPEVVRAAMEELRYDGVCISIDDFGTGFSSMAYLRDLPADHLKIDRIFVREVHRDPRNASICRALISLGHGLGLTIVAEGVETEEELTWLERSNVDYVQGFHIGRPAPLDEFINGFATNRSRA